MKMSPLACGEKWHYVGQGILILVLAFLLNSCKDSSSATGPEQPQEMSFESVLSRGGEFEEVPQSRSTDTLAVSEPYNEDYETEEGGKFVTQRYICTTKTLSVLDGNGHFPFSTPMPM